MRPIEGDSSGAWQLLASHIDNDVDPVMATHASGERVHESGALSGAGRDLRARGTYRIDVTVYRAAEFWGSAESLDGRPRNPYGPIF